MPQEIEGVINQFVLPACGKFGLKFGEIGSPLVDDHHLPVDDGLAGDIEGTGDLGKPLRPVQPVAGVDLTSFPCSNGFEPGNRRT
jgi:hypothetical protein